MRCECCSETFESPPDNQTVPDLCYVCCQRAVLDLATMVRRMAYAARHHTTRPALGQQAMGLLGKYGLQGDVVRQT